MENQPLVAVILGSKSDLDTVRPCLDTLKRFGVPFEAHIMSAHRTPDAVGSFAAGAADKGLKVIIAAAGKAAHLGGFIAAQTTLPVIGLPIKSSTLDGLDSLLSIVQMPSGIPVATVAIDGSANAALLAVEMLALSDPALAEKLKADRKQMSDGVAKKDAELQAELGL
ncbi:MAG: 5-(carboxyamino)imidazole ribonucleotide mutase [Clostridiales bacterium]|nr:5-(carboxyamino)imidazole ribonucleotide mutase [Clostridiales bacterium]